MSDATSQTVYFYNRHPISCEIILTKLRVSRGHLDGLRPEELFPHDQDHYGGLAATDELARGTRVSNGSRVADFCAGLGGTVRYLAHKYGADVTGIELTPARVSGAQELTRRVGLHGTARIIEGNVMDVPLPDASIDAVVSQEAFCHVPDVKRAVAEAFRILRTDGRLAFTDWIANQPLTAADAQLMWEGMAIQPLRSILEYRSLVESVGFRVISTKDLTEEWGPILKERLAMYQLLPDRLAPQWGTMHSISPTSDLLISFKSARWAASGWWLRSSKRVIEERRAVVHHLIAYCRNDACRHQAVIDVSSYPRDMPVPWFKSKVKCAKCGARGNRIDVRPNWKEASPVQDWRGRPAGEADVKMARRKFSVFQPRRSLCQGLE